MFCESCGARLREDIASDPVIIDVSGDNGDVVINEERQDGGFTSTYVGQARVYVASGNNRSCLLIVVAVLLVICCICAGWLAIVENVLF